MTGPLDDDAVDYVAKAIANVGGVDRWSGANENTRDDLREEARAAIPAVLDLLLRCGCRLTGSSGCATAEASA